MSWHVTSVICAPFPLCPGKQGIEKLLDVPMAGLEELKKKLVPLFDAEKGFTSGSKLDPSDSCMVSFSIDHFLL